MDFTETPGAEDCAENFSQGLDVLTQVYMGEGLHPQTAIDILLAYVDELKADLECEDDSEEEEDD